MIEHICKTPIIIECEVGENLTPREILEKYIGKKFAFIGEFTCISSTKILLDFSAVLDKSQNGRRKVKIDKVFTYHSLAGRVIKSGEPETLDGLIQCLNLAEMVMEENESNKIKT